MDSHTTSEPILPPTARLPAIAGLHTHPVLELQDCVAYLRFLYYPEVRGSRRSSRRALVSPVTSTAKSTQWRTPRPGKDGSHEQHFRCYNLDLEMIRADSFERSYAIRWLTTLASRSASLVVSTSDSADSIQLEKLADDAASLIAICAGAAASGAIARVFTFGPSPNGEEVEVMLTDAPLESQDFSSVGAQTWGSAFVMAEMIVDSPEEFGIPHDRTSALKQVSDDGKGSPYKVLELGAGTGLVGLTLGKLFELRGDRASVLLTDFHPSVLANLRTNLDTNFPKSTISNVVIDVLRLDWSTFSSDVGAASLQGQFDLIVAADIIYEENHALWVKSCLEKLLLKGDSRSSPSRMPHHPALFHLIIPLRPTHKFESSTIEQVFACMGDVDRRRQSSENTERELAIIHTERFTCDAYGTDRDCVDEVDYIYYQIGWH